jgi:hypothetical protein
MELSPEFIAHLVEVANGNDDLMTPVKDIVDENEVVFAVWEDTSQPHDVGVLLLKGHQRLVIISGAPPHIVVNRPRDLRLQMSSAASGGEAPLTLKEPAASLSHAARARGSACIRRDPSISGSHRFFAREALPPKPHSYSADGRSLGRGP